MLSGIDALLALERFGTVSEAAVRLNLTQSAVSKRIHALQDELGYALVEPEGRRLRLTPSAVDFLQRARPLVAELRELRTPGEAGGLAHLSLALADSIASSWGPRVLRRALERVQGIELDLHSHRSVLVVESVRLGRYHIGLCTDPLGAMDLIHHPLADEPMVLVNSRCKDRATRNAPLITIEPTAAAWKAIEPRMRANHPQLLSRARVPVESFGAAIQMVRAGFGDGLIPLGLVLESRLDRACYRTLPSVARPVALLVRKTIDRLPSFMLLRERLLEATRSHFAAARTH
ncbi:MAG TPA: LysR family transcriptional regulator [Casimicrobiaceae bacterium]|nr:LysR family transcriptional regulator [Casimicrobiaceae bacterium]